MRLTRALMLEVLRQDYIRTAWSKGMRERRVVVKHALKNAMIPVVTIVGIEVGQIASGTVIFETIFGLPGMGRFLLDAMYQRDYPVVQGVNLLMATIIVFVNLLVDMTYAYSGPAHSLSVRRDGGLQRPIVATPQMIAAVGSQDWGSISRHRPARC